MKLASERGRGQRPPAWLRPTLIAAWILTLLVAVQGLTSWDAYAHLHFQAGFFRYLPWAILSVVSGAFFAGACWPRRPGRFRPAVALQTGLLPLVGLLNPVAWLSFGWWPTNPFLSPPGAGLMGCLLGVSLWTASVMPSGRGGMGWPGHRLWLRPLLLFAWLATLWAAVYGFDEWGQHYRLTMDVGFLRYLAWAIISVVSGVFFAGACWPRRPGRFRPAVALQTGLLPLVGLLYPVLLPLLLLSPKLLVALSWWPVLRFLSFPAFVVSGCLLGVTLWAAADSDG